MTEKVEILGADIGNGRLNAVCGEGADKHIDTASRIHRVQRVISSRENIFTDKGSDYLIGDDAVAHTGTKRREIDSQYFTTPEYSTLGRYAIDRLGLNESPIKIVVGLPVEQFIRDKKALKGVALNISHNIKAAVVAPQPIGTLSNLTLGWDGERISDIDQQRIAVIDIGEGTLDAVEMYKGQPTPDKMGGCNEGIGIALNDIRARILQKHQIELTFEQLRETWNSGQIRVGGENKSVKRIVDNAREGRLFSVLGLVDEIWGNAKNIDKFVVTGGGSAALKSELEKTVLFKNRLVIPKNPQQANADGFYKLGLNMHKYGGFK